MDIGKRRCVTITTQARSQVDLKIFRSALMQSNSFKNLRILLGVIGAGLLFATAAVFLPVEWMANAHRWLGLGEFPDSPITVYLARSTSLLYAVHGFLMLYTAIHLRQYLPLAKVFGYLHFVIGLTMLGIDVTTPCQLTGRRSKAFQ